jgi:hypothetical protein
VKERLSSDKAFKGFLESIKGLSFIPITGGLIDELEVLGGYINVFGFQ